MQLKNEIDTILKTVETFSIEIYPDIPKVGESRLQFNTQKLKS